MKALSSFSLKALARAGLVAVLLLAAAVFGPALAAFDPAQAIDSGAKSCAGPIAAAEKLTHMPEQLLTSVALAESGRWDAVHKAKVAWPWTVTSGNDGRYFSTKAEAIAWVKTLRARGVTNIDVGCMQINLHHHADAFVSLEEAFDPVTNVAYAAAFLMDLFQQKRSWPIAVGLYHSATPVLHFAYRQKVQTIWNEERRRVAEERRQATITAYEQRRVKQQAEAQTREAEARAREEARRVAANTPFVVTAARN
jgi:hypothetical protein